jgi:hypothetical protein
LVHLEQKVADFREVRGKFTPLHHAPKIIPPCECQFVRTALDGDLRHIVYGEFPQQFLPDGWAAAAPR